MPPVAVPAVGTTRWAKASVAENTSTTTTSLSSTMPRVVRATGPLARVSVRRAIVTAGECTTAIDAKRAAKIMAEVSGTSRRNGKNWRPATSSAAMARKVTAISLTVSRSRISPRRRSSSHRSSAPARKAIMAIARLLTGANSAVAELGTVPSTLGPAITPPTR
ncbi:MAG: hypothetical protein U0994_01120 [Gemmatimonadales bacterium]|nr:hypothetical protein [Gemmatimonadales bacterium]